MRSAKVLIIGAGISGLSAARVLTDRGFDVEVIEARERVGGRLHTVDGIDLGAHWIHGTEGNPVTNLARQLSLPTLFVGGDATYVGGWEHVALYRSGGTRLSGQEKLQSILIADRLRDWIDERRRTRALGFLADQSLSEVTKEFLSQAPCTAELRDLTWWHLQLLAREDWAAGAERLSAMNWDDGYEVYGYGDSVLLSGYQAIAEHLAQGVRVRLSCPVRQINYNQSARAGVTIVTDREPITGDIAIVTVPLGVLKTGNIVFDPPLPPEKQAAIQRLGVGALTKVVMWFDDPFWPRDQYVFGLVGDQSEDLPTQLVNMLYSHGLPCLVLFAGGDLGARIEHWTEAKVTEWGMSILYGIFGADLPAPSRVQRTMWLRDPYSRGAYSYVAVGASPGDFEALASPIGDRVLFAGEATDRTHWACVHSAYLSGLREAARVVGDNSIMPARHFTENRRWRDQVIRLSRFFDMRTDELGRDLIDGRCRVLEASDAFKSIPVHEMRLLATMFEQRNLVKGQRLCSFGEAANEVYVVSDGSLAILASDGSRIRTASIGEVVGEYGLFAQMQRKATVVADEPSTVLALDYPRFTCFLNAFPRAMFELMRITVLRLAEHELRDRPSHSLTGY